MKKCLAFLICLGLVIFCLLYSNVARAQNQQLNSNISISNPSQKESYQEKNELFDIVSSNPAEPLVMDGMYKKMVVSGRQSLPYQHVREADVFWEKRIWREIDLRQKMNASFITKYKSFVDVLLEIVRKQEDAYIFLEDNFATPLNINELSTQLNLRDTISVVEPVTGEVEQVIIQNDFDWRSVKKIRLKEDWVFDSRQSRMIVRIIGIAPVREVYDEHGNYRGEQALFWAHYPSFRKYLVKHEAHIPWNDAARWTWEDVLEMRFFASNITKESNMQDLRIKDVHVGADALREAQRIKEKLFTFEQELWEY